MHESNQTPNWQPISFLPSIAEMIDGMLESAQSVLDSLERARTQPHVMDDYTLGRVREAHGTQLNDLWLYEEQLSRWRKDSPTEKQYAEIERLTDQLTALRHMFTLCLPLHEWKSEVDTNRDLKSRDIFLHPLSQ